MPKQTIDFNKVCVMLQMLEFLRNADKKLFDIDIIEEKVKILQGFSS